MSVKVAYTARAHATGGRDGHAATEDGAFEVDLSLPRELGGKGGAGTNPEQLFATAYAACFLSALHRAAADAKAELPVDARVTAAVGVGPRDAGGFGLEVSLEVLVPGIDRSQAGELMKRAHEICPYSNALREGVEVKLALA
jgi:osmotically inducible protein OsmC